MDSVVLQLFQQKQLALGNPVCQIVLNTPVYGEMFGMGAMAWHLLDENNKTQIKNYVQNSALKLLYTKFLILIEVAEFAPKMDMNVNIPEKFKPVLELFQVDVNTQTANLQNELNTHTNSLLQSLKNKENSVADTLNQIGAVVVKQASAKAQTMGVNVMAMGSSMLSSMGSSMMGNMMPGSKPTGGRKSRRRKTKRRRSRRRTFYR